MIHPNHLKRTLNCPREIPWEFSAGNETKQQHRTPFFLFFFFLSLDFFFLLNFSFLSSQKLIFITHHTEQPAHTQKKRKHPNTTQDFSFFFCPPLACCVFPCVVVYKTINFVTISEECKETHTLFFFHTQTYTRKIFGCFVWFFWWRKGEFSRPNKFLDSKGNVVAQPLTLAFFCFCESRQGEP